MSRFRVEDTSEVGAVRRFALRLAREVGLDETEAGRAAIVATELGTNMVRYGKGGEMLVSTCEANGVQLLALDKGPGMADVAACLRDGYSTGGSAGTGLGAVMRQADVADIYSQPGRGTGILAQVYRRGAAVARSDSAIRSGVVCVPYPGEQVCGDGWGMTTDGTAVNLLAVDGLGHGPLAAAAAEAVTAAFKEQAGRRPAEALTRIHDAVGGTRGAAASIARLEANNGIMRYAGVGNIGAAVVSNGHMRKAVSLSGILGHTRRNVREFEYPLTDDSIVVLHSDGLQTSWDLSGYAGLRTRHPSLIAGILYRDFYRGRDDVIVLVASQGGSWNAL